MCSRGGASTTIGLDPVGHALAGRVGWDSITVRHAVWVADDEGALLRRKGPSTSKRSQNRKKATSVGVFHKNILQFVFVFENEDFEPTRGPFFERRSVLYIGAVGVLGLRWGFGR